MILPMKKYAILILLCLCSISACGKSKEKPVTKEASASNLEDVVDEKASSSELAKKVEERKQEEEELALSRYTNLGLVQCDSSFINFRSQPNENDIQNIIGILKNGAGVEILESPAAGTENWVKVRSGGLDGYISKQFLLEGEEAKEKAKEYMEPRVTILAEKLRIRSTPEKIDGNTLGSCAKGERYIVLGRSGKDYLKISADTIEGVEEAYISSSAENVRLEYGLDEARSYNLKQKVINQYDHPGVSKAQD